MNPSVSPEIFAIPVRIYYEDTDAGGVVYYANYLKFLERCRTEWLRSIGHQQAALRAEFGIAFVVRRVNLSYLKPARLDEELLTTLRIESLGHAQIVFRQSIRRANPDTTTGWDELVQGTIDVVCIDVARMKATPIPAFLRTQLEAMQ